MHAGADHVCLTWRVLEDLSHRQSPFVLVRQAIQLRVSLEANPNLVPQATCVQDIRVADAKGDRVILQELASREGDVADPLVAHVLTRHLEHLSHEASQGYQDQQVTHHDSGSRSSTLATLHPSFLNWTSRAAVASRRIEWESQGEGGSSNRKL